MRRLVLILALGSSGCPEEEPPPAEEQPIALDALCAEVARADCERLSDCGALSSPFDLALCQLRQEGVLCAPVAAAIEASVEMGSATFFELTARECRNAVGDLDCSVGLRHDLFALPACRAMVAGNGEDGAVCPLSLACADGFHCVVEDSCPGRCRPYRQNNEPCRAGEPCAPELYCSVTGMRCRARVDLNGVCDLTLDNNPCLDGGFCDSTNPAAMVCVPVRGRGQGCRSSFECIVGATCINSRCSAGEEGDICQSSDDCRSKLECDGGKCVVPLEASAPCSIGSPPCTEGLVCTSSVGLMTCHPRPIAGAPCDTIDCYLSHCEAGVCAAAVRAEEACTKTEECLPEHTCRDVCEVEPIPCDE